MRDKKEAFDIGRLLKVRHALHREPELGGAEFATMRKIRAYLAKLPLEVSPPFLATDTVAFLRGKAPGKCVALRADIDALPIEEDTHAAFASRRKGVMHACGHDVHTAILLGAAAALSRADFAGAVRFIWQPGEEKIALGKKLVEAGALENPAPDGIFALHVSPDLPFGCVGCRPGVLMASSTHFFIEVRGRGAHGSAPEKARNPIPAAAEIALALEKIAADDPEITMSVGVFKSGEMENVIPSGAALGGTLRAVCAENENATLESIRALCRETGRRRKVEAVFSVTGRYPATVNDPAAVETVKKCVGKIPELSYRELERPKRTAEDFSFYLQRHRGAMFHLGIGKTAPLHNNRLLVPDEIIPPGVRLMTELALEALK